MFTSKDDLKLSYGVDMEIGKYLIDRKVPENNLYWKNRLLYIIPMPGYLFIPLYMDIQFRLGLSKKELLSESHLQLIEGIMHSAAKLESRVINFEEHIAECVALVQPVSKNASFLQDLIYYFSGDINKASVPLGMPFNSLNRADAYLFSLCFFDFDSTLKKKLVSAWYALISYYLIVDDLEDLPSDFEQQEENAILEAGLTEQGAQAIEALIHNSFREMNKVNPVMANRIDYKIQLLNVKTVIDGFIQKSKKL